MTGCNKEFSWWHWQMSVKGRTFGVMEVNAMSSIIISCFRFLVNQLNRSIEIRYTIARHRQRQWFLSFHKTLIVPDKLLQDWSQSFKTPPIDIACFHQHLADSAVYGVCFESFNSRLVQVTNLFLSITLKRRLWHRCLGQNPLNSIDSPMLRLSTIAISIIVRFTMTIINCGYDIRSTILWILFHR